MAIIESSWEGCYKENWKNSIVPEAFAHPAKFSRSLIKRIYAHAKEMGWLEPGNVVLDPFGGVALGACDAGKFGLLWVGIELEEKFVKLGQENIKLWEAEGRSILIKGDSRKLKELIEQEFDVVIGSPPYASGDVNDKSRVRVSHKGAYSQNEERNYGKTSGQLGSMKEGEFDVVVSSPPYAEMKRDPGCDVEVRRKRMRDAGIDADKWLGKRRCTEARTDGYGDSEGQLGSMKEGEFDVVVSSPPYSEQPVASYDGSMGEKWKETGKSARGRSGNGKLPSEQYNIENKDNLANMKEGEFDVVVSSPPFFDQSPASQKQEDYEGFKHIGSVKSKATGGYADNSPGQIASMKEGSFDGIVSSPPWDEGEPPIPVERQRETSNPKDHGGPGPQYYKQATLGEGDTFWSASREVVQQCYDLLKPGGHAIWVCKDYVKNKKRVPFSDRWQQLCESIGFKPVCRHKAMLIKKRQNILEETTKEKKSFFRRLAEKKGSPRIDWEDILCLVKEDSPNEGEFDVVVSSPPFTKILHSGICWGDMSDEAIKVQVEKFNAKYGKSRKTFAAVKRAIAKQQEKKDYGHTPGQLANLKEGEFEKIVK